MLDFHVVAHRTRRSALGMMRLIRLGKFSVATKNATPLLSERLFSDLLRHSRTEIIPVGDDNDCVLVNNFLSDVELCTVDQQYMRVVKCVC